MSSDWYVIVLMLLWFIAFVSYLGHSEQGQSWIESADIHPGINDFLMKTLFSLQHTQRHTMYPILD